MEIKAIKTTFEGDGVVKSAYSPEVPFPSNALRVDFDADKEVYIITVGE